MGTIPTKKSQSEHTHTLTLRTAYIATCVTHAYETKLSSQINSYTHLPKMAPQVNGEAPSSAFLSHLISYPVISDSISTFKSNPYGAKSLSITTSLSHKLADPLLPYLTKPYQYVSPYITKADSFGDSTLSTIDSKFPVVKKPTGELIDNGKAIVFFPLKNGSECKKVGGEGIVTWGKAAIATGLVVGGDAYGWLSGFLAGKKAEAKEVSNEKLNN